MNTGTLIRQSRFRIPAHHAAQRPNVCDFNMAVNRRYDQRPAVEETVVQGHRPTATSPPTAGASSPKGQQVLVTGRLEPARDLRGRDGKWRPSTS